MWNVSFTQILREIDFKKARSSKTAFFVLLWTLNSVDLAIFSLPKVQKIIKDQSSKPLIVLKWQILSF